MSLPDDVWVCVLAFCPVRQLLRLCLTSTQLKHLLQQAPVMNGVLAAQGVARQTFGLYFAWKRQQFQQFMDDDWAALEGMLTRPDVVVGGMDYTLKGPRLVEVTPLCAALAVCQWEWVVLLVRARANLSVPAINPPLQVAAYMGHPAWVLDHLVEARAQVNQHTHRGFTPLHCAAAKDHLETVRRLLHHGADPHARNHADDTPLHEAATRSERVTQCLLQHGALVNAVNKNGDTPLHVANRYKLTQADRVLMTHGARVDLQNRMGHTPL